MLDKRAKKFTNVVTVNVFEIKREAVAVVIDFQITVNPKWWEQLNTIKQSKIKNLVPVKTVLIA